MIYSRTGGHQGYVSPLPPPLKRFYHIVPTLQAARCDTFCHCFCSERSLNYFQSEVQSRNCFRPGRQSFIKSPPHQTQYIQGWLQWLKCLVATDLHVSWQTAVLLPQDILDRLAAFGCKYGLKAISDHLILKIFLGEHVSDYPSMCVLTHTSSVSPPPNLKYLMLSLLSNIEQASKCKQQFKRKSL